MDRLGAKIDSLEMPEIGDKLFLRTFYEGCYWYGRFLYPEGAACVRRVLQNNGETLYLESDYIVHHPDVKECLRRGKTGIIYGATAKTKREHPEYYYPKRIDFRIMYAFNPLLVKMALMPTG